LDLSTKIYPYCFGPRSHGFAGVSFYESRHIKEPIVLSRGVTQREFTMNNIEQKISIKKAKKGPVPLFFVCRQCFHHG
jgi:hypothetical protein